MLIRLNRVLDYELQNLKYYRALSIMTPDQCYSDTLKDFCQDEFQHFLALSRLNQELKGPVTSIEDNYEIEIADYSSSLEAVINNTTINVVNMKDIFKMINTKYKRIFNSILIEEIFHIRELYLIYLSCLQP